ncbi:protein LIAT1 [Oryzias latipes]|uniref:protein LIAT1 n=1 Tax=Oryzias latipes TaxID=8090 RepID=UPI0002A49581|nr:protein LIAT1 [Oryzias latipes]XP_020564398.1 protein LIAT1 [Oryzias latipes]
MTVPEDRNFKLIQSDKITQKKKKRKGKKKQKQGIKGSSSTIPENKDKRLSSEISPLLCPQEQTQIQEQLPKPKASKKKNAKPGSGCSQKSKTHQKDSQAMVELTDDTSSSRAMAHETGLGMQARESLRWEGVLQDPQEEAKRLEQYRANRRQRYIAHREALLKDTQQPSREALIKKKD